MVSIDRTSLTRREPIDIMALGWALSITLVLLFVACALVALAVPNAPLAHGWLALFTIAPNGSARGFIDGILGSVVFGWVTAALIGVIYNRLAR